MHLRTFGGLMILALMVLAGCSGLIPDSLPTPLPTEYLPTAIALTIQAADQTANQREAGLQLTKPPEEEEITASNNPTPTASRTPRPTRTVTVTPNIPSPTCCTATTRPPTATRTATATPELPSAAIQISRPGPASKVISPLRVSAYLWTGAGGKIRVELIGEDGRLLVRKILVYSPSNRVYMNTEVEFEISAVAEAGRLVITTDDAEGRPMAVASVDLVLLSIGDSDINPPGDLVELIVIREPLENKLIQGGSVTVTGLAHTGSDLPLLVELVASDGQVVGYRQAAVTPVPGSSHGTFTVDVPYVVSRTTRVRLTISESGGRIAGKTYLNSVEILLAP